MSNLWFSLCIEFLRPIFIFSTSSVSSVFGEKSPCFFLIFRVSSLKSLSTINLLILYLCLIIQLSVILQVKFLLFVVPADWFILHVVRNSRLWTYVCQGLICQSSGQLALRAWPSREGFCFLGQVSPTWAGNTASYSPGGELPEPRLSCPLKSHLVKLKTKDSAEILLFPVSGQDRQAYFFILFWFIYFVTDVEQVFFSPVFHFSLIALPGFHLIFPCCMPRL